MFAYIPVELKSPDSTSDDQVRKVFQKLGYDIRPDEARLDKSSNEIEVDNVGSGRKISVDSNDYHRHIGEKNLVLDNAPAAILKEIKKYGLFTGASGSFQSNLYVTRATNGTIGIWCYQASLERLLPFCEKIGVHLCKGPLSELLNITDLKTGSENFILYSGTGGVVCFGDIQFGKLNVMLKQRMTDIGLILLTGAILGVCVLLKLIPWSEAQLGSKTVKVDPLLPAIRAFVENVWPPSIVALATLMASLLIALLAIPSQQVRWSWQK